MAKKRQDNLATKGKKTAARAGSKTQKVTATNIGAMHSTNGTAFPVVGIGASAGGLEAFKQFFSTIPADSGMAFVLIQHLDPHHESLMAELLARVTEMKVVQVEDKMEAEANHVYIIPPNAYLTISEGVLHLTEPVTRRGMRMPIDFFFRSLAEDQKERAICIILSGTGTDGTLGLKAVKGFGGVVMVQEPATAQYDGMPTSAINTGMADFVLPVEEMPAALIKYIHHPYIQGKSDSAPEESGDDLNTILAVIEARTNNDFRFYKKNTLLRRIGRRMSLAHISDLAGYVELLREKPNEVTQLLKDLLIGVTSFFREPEAYAIIEKEVIPAILSQKGRDSRIRIWVAGCATGEEPYSIAMLLIEQLELAKKNCDVQIFASDIDEEALEFARLGIYPESIAADVGPERLNRFFNKEGETYQISKKVREKVVFARQNLITDPPFSKVDMISCRNLLIYLEPTVQKRIISYFHFAMKDPGYLFLGNSETVGQQNYLFKPISKKWRIYRWMESSRNKVVTFPVVTAAEQHRMNISDTRVLSDVKRLSEFAQRTLMEEFVPATVLINNSYEIFYFFGPTSNYLTLPSGEPTTDLIALVREELRSKVRAVIHKANREKKQIHVDAGKLQRNDGYYSILVTVRPVTSPVGDNLFLVTFQDERGESAPLIEKEELSADESVVRQLEYELQNTREDLQSTIEELETSNEELKASNEEVMSMNEELQSTNEELETSKEELQSLNEELSTVNNQLQDKVEETESTNNDLTNLLTSTDIATIFLDTHLRIKRYTPATTKLLNLIPTDLGRPLSDLSNKLIDKHLPHDIGSVIRDLNPIEKTIEAEKEHWYRRRIVPYRTVDNKIEGVVITFSDITELQNAHSAMQRNLELLEKLFSSVHIMIAYMDRDFNFIKVNQNYADVEKQNPDYFIGRNHFDMYPNDENKKIFSQVVETGRPYTATAKPFSYERHDGKEISYWDWTLQPVFNGKDKVSGLVLSLADVTEREITQQALHQSEHLLRQSLSAAHAGAWSWDLVTDRMHWSDEVYTLAGLSPKDSELTLENWLRMIHPSDRERVRLEMLNAVEEQSELNCEYQLLNPSGETRYLNCRSAIFYNDDKKPVQMVGVVVDVSEKKRGEIKLNLYAKVFENSLEGIVIADADRNVVAVNKAYCRMTGDIDESIVGKKYNMFGSECRDNECAEEKWETVRAKGHWQGEVKNMCGNCAGFYAWVSVSGVLDDNGEFSHYIISINDITERKKAEERIEKLAHYDPLTGLANRVLLYDQLSQALAGVIRHRRRLAILFIDLDRFKNINDTLGHGWGDKLLGAVADRLKRSVRQDDTIARLGGDEFVVVLHDLENIGQISKAAEKLCNDLSIPFQVDDREFTLTASIGVATAPEDGSEVEILVRNADLAMYHAKESGRANWQFYTEEMNSKAHQLLSMENNLRRAIKENELILHYQPQLELESGKLVGFEALLRWQYGNGELVPPNEFLPVAYERGLMDAIDHWVIAQVCQQQDLWREQGLRILPIAVNLSPHYVRQKGSAQKLLDVLASCGLDASHLELELTENAIFENAEEVTDTLGQLNTGGIKLAIDDFGTGYSTLSYLRRFPIDKIKIDRSFVTNLANDPNDVAIVSAIINMAKSLGVRVIAEGVETEEQLGFLKQWGCDEVQGFLYSQPVEAKKYAETLQLFEMA